MQSLQDKIACMVVYLVIVTVLFCPLLWIVVLSLQHGPPFLVFPQHFTMDFYRHVLIDNERGIGTALVNSFVLGSVATALAMVIAVSAVYLVIAGVSSLKWRRRIVQMAIGLYFLPSFAVFPGLKLVARYVTPFGHPGFQLSVIYVLQSFVVAFVLLLLIYYLSGRSSFDQLLLETQSRLSAFFFGVILPSRIATAITAAIAFAIIWSDFFLPALITTESSDLQPFAVKLQMSMQQYRTEYSVFAAGAVLSLLISVLSMIALPGLAMVAYRGYLWSSRRALSRDTRG